MTGTRGYHHGGLRRAVLDAALAVIAADGPAALSLRDLARRAGVSHAAPAHHFGDKAGLLTAIAVEGYQLLGDRMLAAVEHDRRLLEFGAAYLQFALDHPAHFEVMFRPDLYHQDDPELRAARQRSSAALFSAAAAAPLDVPTPTIALAAWALAHGFATLWSSGSLARLAGPEQPVDLFRSMATLTLTDWGSGTASG
jgi:AcrR family transcriptional regulator